MATIRSFTGFASNDLGFDPNPATNDTFNLVGLTTLDIVIIDDDADTAVEGDITNETSTDPNQTVFVEQDGDVLVDGEQFYIESEFTFTIAGSPDTFTGYALESDTSNLNFVVLPDNLPAGIATVQSVDFAPTPNEVAYDDLTSIDEVIDEASPSNLDLSGADTILAGDGEDVVNAGASADSVQGGSGNDSLIGGDGEDSIDGGEGDDTIEGQDGNDVIRGEGDLDNVTVTRESFNWSALPDPDNGGIIDDEDELIESVSQDTGTVTVSFEFTPEARSDGFFFNNSDTQNVAGIDGGGEAVSTTSSARLDGITGGVPGDTSTVALNFASNDPDTLNDVRNVQFRINDLDDASWRDIVQIRAFDADGNPITVDLALGAAGDVTLTDTDGVPGNDTATADQGSGNGAPSAPSNSLLVTVPGPVARIEIDYGNLETGGQRIDLTDIFFDSIQPVGTFDDVISGGEGDDSVLGELGDDSITGDAGLDTLEGGQGDDTIEGGTGNDEIFGGIGADSIEGGADDDSIQGGEGNDIIAGGGEDDSIDGGVGDDEITGDEGNDVLFASTGTDNVQGGDGIDTYTVPGGTTIPDDTETITVTVDVNGNGTVEKSVDGTVDTVGNVENFIADEAAAEDDTLIIQGAIIDETTITGLDGTSGLFINSKTGEFVFFGGAGQPTFAEVLAQDVTGSFAVNDGDLTGTAGNISFQDFEGLQFSVICFTRSTMIDTPDGPRAIEDLRQGDLVTTMDHGDQPIRWIGSRQFDADALSAQPSLRPITIRAGVLGNANDLSVSPQHRMMLSGAKAELMFGTSEVLVKAKDLLVRDDVFVAGPADVEYFHMLFDDHEIVFANGAPSESLHPGIQALDALSESSREEVLAIFPELGDDTSDRKLARHALRSFEARALAS